MTSPKATNIEGVLAMATTPPDLEFTAGEQQTVGSHAENTIATDPKTTLVEVAATSATPVPGDNKEQDVVRENTSEKESQVDAEPVHSAAEATEAAIPDSGTHVDLLPVQPGLVMEMAQLDAMNSLMAYGTPALAGYDPLTGLPLTHNPMNGLPDLQMAVDNSMLSQQPYLDPSPYIPEPDETRISAYAKLEFDDGEFYMNTYSVTLGRDLVAARAAMRREQEEEQSRLEEELSTQEPKTPVPIKREGSRYTKSVISESGGILREESDTPPPEDRKRRSRKASKKSKSTGSSSRHVSRRNSLAQANGPVTYRAEPESGLASQTAGAVPVDPSSLRPSPYECPFVAIHPPAATRASGYKAISRKHVKIAYSNKKRLFEAEILGRNGAFIDDVFCFFKQVVSLRSGSILQVGGVTIRFVLPDVAIGETGAEQRLDYEENHVVDRYSEGGKEMSFDFEESRREGVLADTSSESSRERGEHDEEDQDDDEGDELGEDIDEDEEDAEESEHSQLIEDEDEEQAEAHLDVQPDQSPKALKKRGPGRPPKNGIMSKREQQLAKKEALAQAQAHTQPQTGQKAAKKTVPGTTEAPVPGKNKVGRPRKHPLPDSPPVQREKRKYTKRKPKEPKDGEIKQEGSGGEEVKEKKEKKPPKPPRSPSPTFNEAELTAEQLAKPQANYVTLIYEALSNSPSGQMSLPQIYRAIQRKYPFFVLKCNTNGWQSSVRHNLSQHHAFRKVERDGKGWMWAIVEGVSIEKEKKRRATPPPQMQPGHMHHQPIYQAGHPPHMMPPYGMMGPPPGYPPMHQMPPNMRAGQPPYMGPPPHMNGHPYPQGPPPPMNGQPPPPPFVPPLPPQLNPSSAPTSYSSPYGPKPPTSGSQPQPGDPRPPPEQKVPVPNQASLPPAAPQQQYHPPQQIHQHQHQLQHQAPQPQQQQQHQQPRPTPPGPPPANEHVLRAVEKFRATLVVTLKAKSSNAEAVVDSAIDQVLGITNESAVQGDPQEERIMSALRTMLSQIPGSNIKGPTSARASTSQNGQHSPQLQANQHGTQATAAQQPPKSIGQEKSGPSVMRPSFTGQGQSRLNGSSVPRPPMMTPGMNRTNSGSPANAPPRQGGPSSASPAPTPASVNGASTPKLPVNESGQIVGQKRSLDDGEEMREFKRMSTSGPLQLKT